MTLIGTGVIADFNSMRNKLPLTVFFFGNRIQPNFQSSQRSETMKRGKIRAAISLVALVVAILLSVCSMTASPVVADEDSSYCNCTDPWGREGRGRYVCQAQDCIVITE